ncbi:MAG: histidine phosphatase family protein [Herpetosiphon sp.]
MHRLILIRHAESEHHLRGLTGGWTNTPLSRRGIAQARAVANRCRQQLPTNSSVALFSSDLIRAAQTAEHIAAVLSVECRLLPALRELDNGVAAGLTHAEATRLELPVTEPAVDWIPYPEAESWRMMVLRVFSAMDRIQSDCPSTAIVVTHGNAGVAVIQWWLRLDEQCRQGISFELDPASLTELTVNRWQERTIVRLNDTSHLQHLPDR